MTALFNRIHRSARKRAVTPRGRIKIYFSAVVIAVLNAAIPNMGSAQPTWEYSPYLVNVWVAFGTDAALTDTLYERIETTLHQRAYLIAGATWDLRVTRCPTIFETMVAQQIEALTVEDLLARQDQLKDINRIIRKDDKLLLLAVDLLPDGFLIEAREMDSRTRLWRPVVQRRVHQTRAVPDACFAAIADAFSPLVRIEEYRGKEASVRIRAGGLVTSEASPSHIADDAVLMPVIRRNDRLGEPMDGGIVIAPWTFMLIEERKLNVLECRVHSGFRSALGGRASSRTIKLALAVKPTGRSTALRLESRDETPVPLGGYEIYSKDPITEESEWLGVTDWRGVIRIERGKQPLQVLYVRNGGRLLARLPMVAGLDDHQEMQVYNDDRRLQAEGFVKGVQNKIMDLIAQRQLYIARFRRHLEKKEFDEAKTLLEEFRDLDTRNNINIELEVAAQRITSPNARIQSKINDLFTDTRQLVNKFLDPTTANELSAELSTAQSQS